MSRKAGPLEIQDICYSYTILIVLRNIKAGSPIVFYCRLKWIQPTFKLNVSLIRSEGAGGAVCLVWALFVFK